MAGESWVIVTGAGASTKLGADKAQPLPLMYQWSNELVDRLEANEPGLADVVGLKKGLPGEEFETQLGRFLKRKTCLTPLRSGPLSLGATSLTDPRDGEAADGWFERAQRRADRALTVIRESLYREFGGTRVGQWAPKMAYQRLFEHLRIDGTDTLTYVTTNYDSAGEIALQELGRRPFNGEDRQYGTECFVHADAILGSHGSGHTPVLHLHGKVGWYLQGDRVQVVDERAAYNDGFGVPALLLPDPEKEYEELEVVTQLWDAFAGALGGVDRILVLGHSLFDRRLVDALRTATPRNAIGVTMLHYREQPDEEVVKRECGRIVEAVPGACVLPVNFGPDAVSFDRLALEGWLDRNTPSFPNEREG
jgi:hypothetical protein